MNRVSPVGFGAVFALSRADAGRRGGDAIGEPLTGQPLDQLRQRRGTGGVQIVAARATTARTSARVA